MIGSSFDLPRCHVMQPNYILYWEELVPVPYLPCSCSAFLPPVYLRFVISSCQCILACLLLPLVEFYWVELLLARVRAVQQVCNMPLDWALGAFILRSTTYSDVCNRDWIATIIGDESPTLLSLIALLIILMFTAWSISRWWKPQLKTIYDLEKGRYIVTRVGRHWIHFSRVLLVLEAASW